MPKVGEREKKKKKHVIDLSFLCSSSKLYDFLYQYQLSLKCCQKCSLFLPMDSENRNKKCDFLRYISYQSRNAFELDILSYYNEFEIPSRIF